jgi:hypothetical protein
MNVPAAPRGKDPVMWVLVDHKKGFCNYYASAEVLLLRAIGIPARLAVGFARSESADGAYTVYRRNAHAWPEVYFPGIGWVEFEPTSSQAPLARPSAVQPAAGTPINPPTRRVRDGETERTPEEVEIAPPSARLPFPLTPAGRAVLTALAVLVVLVLIGLAYRLRLPDRLPGILARALVAGAGPAPPWLRSWERWNRMAAVERAFASVSWSLHLLGDPPHMDATPAAQATALSRLVPSAARQIEAISAEVERGLFTVYPADLGLAYRAGILILLRSLGARLRKTLTSADGRVAYSHRD